jgi:hypothetical protein
VNPYCFTPMGVSMGVSPAAPTSSSLMGLSPGLHPTAAAVAAAVLLLLASVQQQGLSTAITLTKNSAVSMAPVEITHRLHNHHAPGPSTCTLHRSARWTFSETGPAVDVSLWSRKKIALLRDVLRDSLGGESTFERVIAE